ncbi:hypothetical protein [Homoserinibacter sp. YIM 151385]|uniref:hypothetical protein n=1 Tax=Homoserinibacter sp. YIM 151385 TaxID=2985506 RepID=UPI0022F1348F|nr:hypothetical protein [Homoserinibacter sp. YIM 151385]WBU37160.1 hypothetical protein OF852_09520 [Homoserinibacter sp. YIM 151385]
MTDANVPPAPARAPQHLPRFFVKQRITLGVNRYEIRAANPDGSEGRIIGMAQQKRFALKEQVTFYADEQRTQPVFSFRARQVMDLAAIYDVTDGQGVALGWFQKDFTASLLRSSFHLAGPGIDAYGQERNQAIALIRRFVDLPFSFHFDFTDKTSGRVVMSSERQFSLRDRYTVDVPDERVDYRLAAAMAVGLDALLGR